MRTIDCPKCSSKVPIPVEDADSRGRVRLVCDSCGARVLVKVNPRDLKLSPTIPLTTANPDLVPDNREYSGMWGVLVYKLDRSVQAAFRRTLLAMPRYRGNPNKLHDATAELPYVFHGLKRGEGTFLEEELSRLKSGFESGPEEWLLDEAMIPRPRDLRGPKPSLGGENSDIEVLSAVPGSSWEIHFDGGRPSRSDLQVSNELDPSRPNGGFGTHPPLRPIQRLMQSQDEARLTTPTPLSATAPRRSPRPAGFPSKAPAARPPTPAPAARPPTPQPPAAVAPTPRPPTEPEMRPLASNDDHLWGEFADELSDGAIAAVPGNPMAEAGTLDPTDLSAMADAASRIAAKSKEEEGRALAQTASVAPGDQSMAVEIDEDYDDAFAIVSINELPGKKFHIGALHTTISVSANELDVGSQTSVDVALEQAHGILQQRAQELGGTGIVGLRVTQSAIPTKAGWMLIFVVSGTAVA
ncbi:MAG: hypothetical protein KDA24_03510 [Deltaproteobacteria bacterium]|nr:hypothetical protein [Deltaproteobacteria bacterium]